jgi:hypothetical protein
MYDLECNRMAIETVPKPRQMGLGKSVEASSSDHMSVFAFQRLLHLAIDSGVAKLGAA